MGFVMQSQAGSFLYQSVCCEISWDWMVYGLPGCDCLLFSLLGQLLKWWLMLLQVPLWNRVLFYASSVHCIHLWALCWSATSSSSGGGARKSRKLHLGHLFSRTTPSVIWEFSKRLEGTVLLGRAFLWGPWLLWESGNK